MRTLRVINYQNKSRKRDKQISNKLKMPVLHQLIWLTFYYNKLICIQEMQHHQHQQQERPIL